MCRAHRGSELFTKEGKSMARRADEKRSYPVNINYFADKSRNINSAGLNLSFQSENPTPDGGVWFRIIHGMSFSSYGEKITITLTPTPTGTDVHILSECGMPTQLVDYGKNKSNVQVIFNYLEQGMPMAGAYAAPQAAPQAAPSQNIMYCPNCGKPYTVGSNFCGGCGTRLQ